ncbi:unnamed protein product [Mytilus coruscus]|uniref:PIF1 n=1 Tax=Mytilus coruscus TaxID=42192 RepID=A0A6J8AEY2_MYTCO|nr:unnamed protein product [Mytilus coruscus]
MPELENNRKKYSHLYGKDVEKTWTPIFDIKRSFTYKYRTFERIQFPLRPAAGKTIHKSQGDTLQEVVVSLKSKRKGKIPHIHYVALSRVKSLTGLQILDLNQETIAVAECVRQELPQLRTDATLQLCFKPLYNLSSNYFKVVFNNARYTGLRVAEVKKFENLYFDFHKEERPLVIGQPFCYGRRVGFHSFQVCYDWRH